MKSCKTQSRVISNYREIENSHEVSSEDDEIPIPIVPKPMSPVAKDYSKMKHEKSPGSLFTQHYERSNKSVAPSASKRLKENLFYPENTEETPANEFSLDNFIQQTANKFIEEIKNQKEFVGNTEYGKVLSKSSSNKNPYVTPTK